MIRSGVYPDALKHAIITPIPKGGDVCDVSKFRPVSLLPTIDKLFEKLLHNQMIRFMEKNKLFDQYQYGFREGRGCQNAIAKLFHKISLATDSNKSVLLVSFDISKAFDSVNISILLSKLQSTGFRGNSLSLLRSFLTNRTQTTKFKEALSESGIIGKGVPQGSNLGPLLFNIMINDLQSLQTYAFMTKFADDLLLVLELEKIERNESVNSLKLVHDLSLLENYYKMNDLSLNCMKSRYLIIGGVSDMEIEAVLDGREIQKCDNLKYLGIDIDASFRLESHVDKLARNLVIGINALKHLKRELNLNALMNFYNAHFNSHISYYSFVLLRAKSTDIDRLQILQNKAIKIIYGLPFRFPTTDLYTRVTENVLTVIGIIYLSTIVMVWKCIKSDDLSLPPVTRLRNIARNKNLVLPKVSKKDLRRDITHSGCKLYNQLPNDIKDTSCFKEFKVKVRKFILLRTESLLREEQFAELNFHL
jgi:retron-type reverse transcriptase